MYHFRKTDAVYTDGVVSLLFGGEFFLGSAAKGALIILGKVFKLGSGGNAVFGIADFLIIYETAKIANVLHCYDHSFLLRRRHKRE